MTVTILQKLQDHGWYISDQGYNLISDFGNLNDIQKIIKQAIDHDLREIGSGLGDINNGNIVLQIQKIRNVSAPKNNEESRSAPRMLKLSLTDGKNNIQAIEIEHISAISLNTPPGTKLLLKPGTLLISRGILLLRPSDIASILGGKVTNLIEKWELNKKLATHSRVRSAEEGGPPPWIPFGKKIIKVTDQDGNFKALAEKEKTNKENTEFEAQRKDAIAEASKQGSKKIFGGGTKQLLDHSVQKIVDQGFTIEQAEYALKVNRNNIDRALRSLQKTDNKHSNREPREPRNKRFDKKTEEVSKPSSGKISLFDFLEDKLPIQPEPAEVNLQKSTRLQDDENNFERFDYRNGDAQTKKSARSQRGGRQTSLRRAEDIKNAKRSNCSGNITTPQYSQYNGVNSGQQNKPPRFQRQENQYQHDNAKSGFHQKPTQSDFRNSFNQLRLDTASIGNNTNVNNSRHVYEQQGKNMNSNKNFNQVESEPKNRPFNNVSYGKINRDHNGTQRISPVNTTENFSTQSNRYKSTHVTDTDNYLVNSHTSRTENQNISVPNKWLWRVGDKCMAKYWEDNRYYNAVVTGVSDRTCVVQFKGFENFEEVLQADCIPITENNIDYREYKTETQDTRFYHTKHQKYDQNHMTGGIEFRRGGNGGSASSNKNHGKRRGQQRSSQPIYQPPPQRSNNVVSGNNPH